MKTRYKKTIMVTAAMLILVILAGAWHVYRSHSRPGCVSREVLSCSGEAAAQSAVPATSTLKDAVPAMAGIHVYSHRGYSGIYEHSFKAYDDVIAAGTSYIEQDIVISSDGVLFVSHDTNALFMTGHDAEYSSMSAEEIEGLRTKAGYKVLRLSEVFDRYGRSVNYLIELKNGNRETVEAFEEMIDRYGYEDIVTVQCTEADVLETLDHRYPDMPKLLVCKKQTTFEAGLEMPYVDILSVKYSAGLMTEANCSAAHEHGKLFSAWWIDSEAQIREAIDMGVDTYFTNDTALALSLEKEYGLTARKAAN